MKLILIGDEGSKRTIYLEKAAKKVGVSLQIINWKTIEYKYFLDKLKNICTNENFKYMYGDAKDVLSKKKSLLTFSLKDDIDLVNKNLLLEQDIVDLEALEGAVIKIDPPSYETVQLVQMQKFLEDYQNNLKIMMQMSCQFLNEPEAILKLLDKKETKLQLQSHEVPVTKMFDEDVWCLEQLLELMKKKRCYSVFVKPRCFSGAAGVVAFRIHPVNGKMRMYTSCQMDGDCLVNTKKMIVLDNKQEIASFMEKLLELGCIVERWYPKDEFEGKSYDLRVVYQFGHIAYIVVRQSRGPITNLHLNNHAMDIKELGLSQEKIQEIESVCKQAVEVFPGLNVVGIDIMLEKGTLRPLIIEMNGQGDLIYQDIYGENLIYSEQIEKMLGIM